MRGIDYVYTLQIDFFEAKNGAKKRVQFPDNNKVLDITIPAGISSGQRLRLRGKGGPGVNGGQQGDAFIEIEVLPAHNS